MKFLSSSLTLILSILFFSVGMVFFIASFNMSSSRSQRQAVFSTSSNVLHDNVINDFKEEKATTGNKCPPVPTSLPSSSSSSSEGTTSQSTTQSTLSSSLPPSNLHSTYLQKLFRHPVNDLFTEQFTILIMTYKRVSILLNTIPHYCTIGQPLHKILIVWNDIGNPIPNNLKSINCGSSKLEFILSKKNKLTNRFLPYKEIETEGVAIIDDDRKVVISDLVFAFHTWQQFRHRIVGFEQRTFDTLPDGTYFYGTKRGLQSEKYGYSAMISATFIMSKVYLEMYQMPQFLPSAIYNYIDTNMNCEDLAMCIMVTDFLMKTTFPQTCCIAVRAKRYPINLEATNHGSSYRGLSMRRGHYNGRSDCLNYFSKSYNGSMPLIYTHSRVCYDDDKYYQ